MTTFPGRPDPEAGSVLVLGNGSFPSRSRLAPFLRSSLLTVACDGAADKALKAGIVPDVLIGDLDSASPAAKKKVRRVVAVADQDSTDLDKALDWLTANGFAKARIVLAGFTGGRSDFTLYNIHRLRRYGRLDLVMIDDLFTVFAARSGTAVPGLEKGTLVSLVPVLRSAGVTTTGLKWNLKNAVLEPGGLESASNRASAATVRVTYRGGFLLWFVGAESVSKTAR